MQGRESRSEKHFLLRAWWEKYYPFAWSVRAAFGAVMAVLLAVGIVAYRSVIASFDSAQWAQHTDEVLEHLANLRLHVESLDSGYRSFALGGSEQFLERSRVDASLADEEATALRQLTVDNSHQQHRLNVVADLLRRMVQRNNGIKQPDLMPGKAG